MTEESLIVRDRKFIGNNSLLPCFRSPHHCNDQEYPVDNRECDESHHHIKDLHVTHNRDDRSRHKNQINDDKYCQLLLRH